MFYLHSPFHMPTFKSLLVIMIKLKGKEYTRILTNAVFIFFVLQINYLNKITHLLKIYHNTSLHNSKLSGTRAAPS